MPRFQTVGIAQRTACMPAWGASRNQAGVDRPLHRAPEQGKSATAGDEQARGDQKAIATLERQIMAFEKTLAAIDAGDPAQKAHRENLEVALAKTRELLVSGSPDERVKVAELFAVEHEKKAAMASKQAGTPVQRSAIGASASHAQPAAGRVATPAPKIARVSQQVQRMAPAAAAPLAAAGPVGWIALGVIALVVVGVAVYQASRSSSSSSSSSASSQTRSSTYRPSGTCNQMMTACMLTSLADQSGSVFGENRCVFCAQVCRRNGGVWPTSAPTTRGSVRCDYWNYG